ncbi:AMP-binding enzyme [Brochothrix thermosphacta]|uniref:AMP-binding enzyme n=1 Tax=Brochothrix thermosphacta TaxID=2756 RepID=UPI0034E58362
MRQVLNKIEGIADSYIYVHSDKLTHKSIIAFVVGDNLSGQEIRKMSGKLLPSYMVPNQCICIDYLPLNKNDKVDKEKHLQKKIFPAAKNCHLPKTETEK